MLQIPVKEGESIEKHSRSTKRNLKERVFSNNLELEKSISKSQWLEDKRL